MEKKKNNPIEMHFGKKYVPHLKVALEKYCRENYIKNDSIVFTEDGFNIVRETKESVLFMFGMYYGMEIMRELIKKDSQ